MHVGISPRSSTTTAPPCGNSHADLQTHPPNEAATCQPVDQTRDEFMITPSVLPAKSQSFISVEQHSSKQGKYTMGTQCGTLILTPMVPVYSINTKSLIT